MYLNPFLPNKVRSRFYKQVQELRDKMQSKINQLINSTLLECFNYKSFIGVIALNQQVRSSKK